MDSELIVRACGGDIACYGELVRRHQKAALRAAYLVVGDAFEAEEIVQDAFVRAFRALDEFELGAPFRPWLLRIVTNEALNRRRSNERRVQLERRVSMADQVTQSVDSPEITFLADERRDQLEAALAEMKDMDRIVLVYRYFLDMPINDMACVLNCTESTVRTRISRALVRLRELMVERTETWRYG